MAHRAPLDHARAPALAKGLGRQGGGRSHHAARRGGPSDFAASLAIAVGAVIAAVIVIPLLLFGIELILLGLLIAIGILGRGLLGRPWIVEARASGAAVPAYMWRVSGWRHSALLIDEVATALSAGLSPRPAGPVDAVVPTPSS